MNNGKRRDWYDEIYDAYVSSQLLGDDHDILEWTPFGKNSIDILFNDGKLYRYNYFSDSITRLDRADNDIQEMTDQMKALFPRKLNKAIKDACLTQNAVAEKAGISEVTISRYCSGLQVPNIIIVSILAKILKCELYELIPFYDYADGRIK